MLPAVVLHIGYMGLFIVTYVSAGLYMFISLRQAVVEVANSLLRDLNGKNFSPKGESSFKC